MTTILVAEDDPIVQRIVRAAVEHCGFRCEVADNGAICLERLKTGAMPDLLLLDLMMPVMGGIEVLQALKGKHPEGRFPIVVFSAKNQQEAVVEAIELGADDYVVKPFIAQDLIKRMSDLVFNPDEAKLRHLLLNLRMHDPALATTITQLSSRWKNHDIYPVTNADGALCVAVPVGRGPQAIAKLSVEDITATIGIFRRGTSGWRKVWPRFSYTP